MCMQFSRPFSSIFNFVTSVKFCCPLVIMAFSYIYALGYFFIKSNPSVFVTRSITSPSQGNLFLSFLATSRENVNNVCENGMRKKTTTTTTGVDFHSR